MCGVTGIRPCPLSLNDKGCFFCWCTDMQTSIPSQDVGGGMYSCLAALLLFPVICCKLMHVIVGQAACGFDEEKIDGLYHCNGCVGGSTASCCTM